MTSSPSESSTGPVPEASWPWSDDIVLTHSQFELSQSTVDDAEGLFEALDSEDVWVHVKGRPATVDKWREVIAAACDVGRWMWTVRQAGKIVGTSSFLDLSVVDARVEIGHTTYARSVWGSQVNPACKFLLLGWAFEEARMNRVQLKTDIRNVRSQSAIERLGATPEGVLRMYQRRHDDSIRDTAMYSVLASEWPVIRKRLIDRLQPSLS
jgi:RimJ/RimL family protein N-acetyltransferase